MVTFSPAKKVRPIIPTTQRSLIRICENAHPQFITWYLAIVWHFAYWLIKASAYAVQENA